MFKTYFLDVITKHYVDFAGRATRTQFWLFTLFNFIITCVLYVLGSFDNGIGALFDIVYVLYGLAVLLPSIAMYLSL